DFVCNYEPGHDPGCRRFRRKPPDVCDQPCAVTDREQVCCGKPDPWCQQGGRDLKPPPLQHSESERSCGVGSGQPVDRFGSRTVAVTIFGDGKSRPRFSTRPSLRSIPEDSLEYLNGNNA